MTVDDLTAPQHYGRPSLTSGEGLFVFPVDPEPRVSCVNANNPYGHNPDCPCQRLRAAPDHGLPAILPDEVPDDAA